MSVYIVMLLSTAILFGVPQSRAARSGAGVPTAGSEDSQEQQWCNFLPLGPGQICCDGTLPVNVTSPDHDDCCLNQDTGEASTFNSNFSYCHYDTGEVRAIPVFSFAGLSELSNAIDQVPGNRYSYDSEEEQPELPWCVSGGENELFRRADRRGAGVKCCGDKAYLVSRHICCAGLLYNNTAGNMICCYDKAYEADDTRNPCLSQCGASVFNRETELCCHGAIHPSTSQSDICCGSVKIDTNENICCGDGAVMPRKDRHHRCCQGLMPYHRVYMQCHRRRQGGVTRKVKRQFKAAQLCGRLPTWNPQWPSIPLLSLPDSSARLLHVQGRVMTLASKRRGKNLKVTLNLSVILHSSLFLHNRPNLNSSCSGSHVLHVVAGLGSAGNRKRKCQGRKLQRYLLHHVLQVFFPLSSLSCNEDGEHVVRVPRKSAEHLIMMDSVKG